MSWKPKTFEELLDAILTDYRNQLPGADTSQGSLLFIRASALASALWGAYRHQDWIFAQIFPDSADRESLEHHAAARRLAPLAGESEEALLARLQDDLRYPPAGGNCFDYPRWAREVEGVAGAWLYTPVDPEAGSVYLVVTALPASGSEIPDSPLLAAVWAHIDALRPVAARNHYVTPPTIAAQNVTMVGSGPAWDPEKTAAALTAWLGAFVPGQVLTMAALYSLAVQHGAADVVISLPVANVTPVAVGMLRPGVIDVT